MRALYLLTEDSGTESAEETFRELVQSLNYRSIIPLSRPRRERNSATILLREADDPLIAAGIIPELIKSPAPPLPPSSSPAPASPAEHGGKIRREVRVRKLFAFNSPHFVSAQELVPLITTSGRDDRTRKVPCNSKVARGRVRGRKGSSA